MKACLNDHHSLLHEPRLEYSSPLILCRGDFDAVPTARSNGSNRRRAQRSATTNKASRPNNAILLGQQRSPSLSSYLAPLLLYSTPFPSRGDYISLPLPSSLARWCGYAERKDHVINIYTTIGITIIILQNEATRGNARNLGPLTIERKAHRFCCN